MAQLASDNFTRANNSSIGAPWIVAPSFVSDFQIVSDTCQPGALTDDECDYYSGISWPNNQYAEVTYSATDTSGDNHGIGPAVRIDSASQSLYRCTANGSGYEVYRFVAGVGAALSSGTGTTFTTGDRLTLQINGSTWTVLKNGTQFDTGTDTSLTAGNAGIAHSGTSAGPVAVSLWAGGSISSGTNPLAGNVVAAVVVTGTFTGFGAVTLTAPLYTGIGGILDPNFWFDSKPIVGSVVYYDPTYITVLPNGEINSTSNNCKSVVQFFDGTSWALGLVVFTPNLVGYIDAATALAGSLRPIALLGGNIIAATTMTGLLTSSASALTGHIVAATVLTGSLLGAAVNLSGSIMVSAALAGNLSVPAGPLIPVLNPIDTVISQYANSPTILQIIQSSADSLLN